MRKLLLVAAALFAVPVAAQQPPPPKLLVVISVDQLSSDLLNEYRPQFTAGLARLASGAVFRNGSTTASPALGDLMKAQWPASRNVAVSGNASAPAMSGNAVDQRWNWGGTSFATDRAGASVPSVVPKLNAAVAAGIAQARPPLTSTPFCQSKAPANPARRQLSRAAGDAASMQASPELDGDTLALAAGLADEMQLGRHADPDLLSVHLSATGNVGRAYGASGEEMCLQLTELDREIGDFLSLLDSRGIDYAVMLTGEPGTRVPILIWRPGFAGATTDTALDTADIIATLAALIELPLPSTVAGGHCIEGTPAFCQKP